MGFITVVGTLSFLFAGLHRHSFFPSARCTSLCLEGSLDSSNNEQQAISVFNRTVAKYGLEKAKEIQRENARKGNTAFAKKYGSMFNATVEKYGLEKALEIQRENGRKANKAFKEKYGSVFNATFAKYGIEKALEMYRENGRKNGQAHTEKYGSVFNATAQKYGLEKALEITRANGRKTTEMYGTVWDRTAQKYGVEKVREMRRETSHKAMEKHGNVWDRTKSKHGLKKANEMFRQNARKAKEARLEKYTYEEIQQMGSNTGVETARKRGHYTRYPGIRFRKDTLKWRVQFKHKGKIHNAGSSYATEDEAALAHDEYVRNLGLNRPLHFPREGERTSYVDDEPP